jgi:asparagine synthase (glutamine-hydrolysing)
MMRLQTSLSKLKGWSWSHENVEGRRAAASGYAFQDDRCLHETELVKELLAVLGQVPQDGLPARLTDFVRSLNGTFALFCQFDGKAFAAVDRMRGIPLFYGDRGGTTYLSDDARWVRDQVGDVDPDEGACEEFAKTGYVTGAATLFPGVRQLRPGQAIWLDGDRGDIDLIRYFEWVHGDFLPDGREAMHCRLDAVLKRAFERLAASVGDRAIVVPLSGGLDSRLVVTMLKRVGQDNVLCYTYGRRGNRESEVSRQVAAALGYRWEFAEYTRRKWADWYARRERIDYYRYGDGLTSLPHIQDCPAVAELIARGFVPGNAVFVPGHTGDFICGGHLSETLGDVSGDGEDHVTRAVWKRHHRLDCWSTQYSAPSPAYRTRILGVVGDVPMRVPEEAASAYELWEWQERQCKYICNSCRVYEFFGHQWRIPLWDAELMDFWARVPLEMRLGKRLYTSFLQHVNPCGLFEDAATPANGTGSKAKAAAKKLRPLFYGGKKLKNIWYYWNNDVDWYGIVPFWRFLLLHGAPAHLSASQCRMYLEELEREQAVARSPHQETAVGC